MIVKNALKEDNVSGFESLESQKNINSPDFMKKMVEEFNKYGTKEYGETIKIEILKKMLPQDVLENEKVIIKRVRRCESQEDLFRFMAPMSMLIALFIGVLNISNKMYPFNNIDLAIIYGVLIVCLLLIVKYKNEKYKLIKASKKLVVNDQSGNPIKAIWFWYHNLEFKNDEQRNMFLENNYAEYKNKSVIIDVEDCVKLNVSPDNYLESFKDKMVNEIAEYRI